jgi:hypothetical protein
MTGGGGGYGNGTRNITFDLVHHVILRAAVVTLKMEAEYFCVNIDRLIPDHTVLRFRKWQFS